MVVAKLFDQMDVNRSAPEPDSAVSVNLLVYSDGILSMGELLRVAGEECAEEFLRCPLLVCTYHLSQLLHVGCSMLRWATTMV